MTTCVDLFAGGGGFSTGAVQAGATVLWAGNHWREAVEVHQANHKDAIHLTQDLHQANWLDVPGHDILLASPCCQGHSRARGKDRPHHDAARSTAWAVTSAVECHRPKAFIVENVPMFQQWSLYPAWAEAMRLLGYTLSLEVLDAQYFGVPQQRKRLFIVGMKKGSFKFSTTRPQEEVVPISSVLKLDEGDWSPISDSKRLQVGKRVLADATKARIAVGRERFSRHKCFWLPYFSSNIAGYGIDRPLWTVTTRDRFALCLEDRMRILTVDEVRGAMGFPEDYRLTGKAKLDKHLLGNSVCPPVAKWIVGEVMKAVA